MRKREEIVKQIKKLTQASLENPEVPITDIFYVLILEVLLDIRDVLYT